MAPSKQHKRKKKFDLHPDVLTSSKSFNSLKQILRAMNDNQAYSGVLVLIHS